MKQKYQQLKVGTPSELYGLMAQKFQCKQQLLVFYSSLLDRLITNPSFMVIPFYDRMNIRGHSIFDTVNIRKGKFMNLNYHIERLQSSMALTCMKLPMNPEEIKVKLAQIAQFCYDAYKEIDWELKQVNIRYWVSAGIGDLNIASRDEKSILYAIATSRDIYPAALQGIKDYSISLDGIEFKHGAIAKAKTNNYMHNALVAKSSALRGGFIGIMLDEDGFIIEGSIGNVAFVTQEDKFLVPANENKLEGTTLKNAMKRILQLVQEGQLKEIIEIAVKPADVYHSVKEMIIFKGDDVIPVLEWPYLYLSYFCFKINLSKLQQYMFDIGEKDAIPISEYLQLIDNDPLKNEDNFEKERNESGKKISQFKFEINESNIMNQEKDSTTQVYRIRSSSCCNDLVFDSSPEEEKSNVQNK